MKRLLILAVSASMALTGCTKNEAVSVNSGADEIGFKSYSGREITKGETSLGEGDSFNVAAYYDDGSAETVYFESQLYEYSTSSSCFVSDPIHYWPSSGTLDFYAVSPASITADKTVAFTADGSTDFSAVCLTDQSKAVDASPTLNFGHKLTKVAVKAVGADTQANLKYVVSSVTITAASQATYTMSTNSWGTSNTSKTYTILNTATDIIGSSPVTLGDTKYLLPKQGSADYSVTASISYKVYQKDATAGGGSYRCTYVVNNASVDLTASVTAAWGINKSVIYSLTLPANDTEGKITFTATVTDWNSGFVPEGFVDFGTGVLWSMYNLENDFTFVDDPFDMGGTFAPLEATGQENPGDRYWNQTTWQYNVVSAAGSQAALPSYFVNYVKNFNGKKVGRVPTLSDFQALLDTCNMSFDSDNYAVKLTSETDASKFIYFPFVYAYPVGYAPGDPSYFGLYYWTQTASINELTFINMNQITESDVPGFLESNAGLLYIKFNPSDPSDMVDSCGPFAGMAFRTVWDITDGGETVIPLP